MSGSTTEERIIRRAARAVQSFSALIPDLKTQKLCFEIQRQLELVGPSGLEPPTLRLSVVRSSQLSYGPVVDVDFISFAASLATQLIHSVTSPLRVTNASLVCAAILDEGYVWWR